VPTLERTELKSWRRKIMLISVLLLIFLTNIPSTNDHIPLRSRVRTNSRNPLSHSRVSEAGGEGNSQESLMFLTRQIADQEQSILNSFANTSNHSGNLDLTEYYIAGWTLYSVVLDVQQIVAVPEREVIGSTLTPTSNDDFMIREQGTTNFYYNQLAQGFFNMSHNGQLENFSVIYETPSYFPAQQNYAYFEVRSEHDNGSTNMITPVQLENVGLGGTWVDVSQNAILMASHVYFVVINGSLLQEVSNQYPRIRWLYDNQQGIYETYRHNTDGPTWGSNLGYAEGMMNYTYTPWNITYDQPLNYTSPTEVQIRANSTSMSGDSWIFTSDVNISSISFNSNQSVSVFYDLNLSYKRNVQSNTQWSHIALDGSIEWNMSSVLTYPSENGIIDRGLNLSIPTDWIQSGLYSATDPTTNQTTYTRLGNVVSCSGLGDDAWTLVCSAPNYIDGISKYDASNNNPIGREVNISIALEINATIESPSSLPAITGSTNLRVIYQTETIQTDVAAVASGISSHYWIVQQNNSGNGIHVLELQWTNGTEAGYLTEEVVVVYSTNLTATTEDINTYTDNSFLVSVFFNDTFTPRPLNDTLVDVVYSFAGGANTSMFDHENGTWTQTIDTSGKSPGSYSVVVYGEGFGYYNSSVAITVTLIHDTDALDISWSNTPAITYVQGTDLIVSYRRSNGDNVTNAQVNVTIGVKTWNLTWHSGSETYRIRFNGTDNPPGLGNHSLSISAWRIGYEAQSNNTGTLTIDKEGTSLAVSWSNTNNITYLDHTILSVKYLSNSTSIEIQGAELNVTDGSTTWDLIWNNDTKAYEIQLNGTDMDTGLGTHFLTIQATLYGYYDASDSTQNFTIREELTIIVLYWSTPYLNNITFIQQTTLYANFTLLDNTPIELSTVNVTFGTITLELKWNNGLQRYQIVFNGTDNPPEFGNHSLSVQAWRHGFQYISDTTSLVIRRDPTTITKMIQT